MQTQKSFRHNELIHLQNLERQGTEHSILRVAARFSPLCYGKCTVIARRSSVAKRGRGAYSYPPIGLKSMQNNLFLVLLRPIFAKKMKTALPMGLASRSCEGVAVIRTRKVQLCLFGPHLNLVRKSDWIAVKTFLGGDHPISAGKTVSILVKTFFLRLPDFDRKIASIWFKTDSSSFTLDSSFQTPPPPPFANFSLRAWPGAPPDFC